GGGGGVGLQSGGEEEEIEMETSGSRSSQMEKGADDPFAPGAKSPTLPELLMVVVTNVIEEGGPNTYPILMRLFNHGVTVTASSQPHFQTSATMASTAAATMPDPKTEPSKSTGGRGGGGNNSPSLGAAPSQPVLPGTSTSTPGNGVCYTPGVFQCAMLQHLATVCQTLLLPPPPSSTLLGSSGSLQSMRASGFLPGAMPLRAGAGAGAGGLAAMAAVASAVADAGAKGLLPGTGTETLALTLLLGLLRQASSITMPMLAMPHPHDSAYRFGAAGLVDGGGPRAATAAAAVAARRTLLSACHVAAVVALRRTSRA
ncbi:unnamed protein product, partial [Discosporangium mesarthrocarpum]